MFTMLTNLKYTDSTMTRYVYKKIKDLTIPYEVRKAHEYDIGTTSQCQLTVKQ